MRRMLISKTPIILLLFLVLSEPIQVVRVAHTQELPPPDILNAIIRKLVSAKPPRTEVVFRPDGAAKPADPMCRMNTFDMRLMRNDQLVRSYSVLVSSRPSDQSVAPTEFLALLTRVTVDADGSPRAYHPEDPDGAGMCELVRGNDGRSIYRGICALDKFSSGGIKVFRAAEEQKNQDLIREWRLMWPQIRDKRIKPFTLTSVAGREVPKSFYFFYWPERKLTALFRENIIPKDVSGYPCMHDGNTNYAGYFVASTTLTHDAPARADGCAPARYIDAEQIPFFVLPKGGFGKVGIGDLMVARLKQGDSDRIIYGLIADAGPAGKLGEGSVALNAALLGKGEKPILNLKDTWALDISGPAVAILVFGGTRSLLKRNYSKSNIESVARQVFARWGGNIDPIRRLDACMAQAKVNSKKQ